MPDNRVVIQYDQAVERAPGVRRHNPGETYTVRDAATAEAIHPKAKIRSYADGRKFVRTQDESLAEIRAAEEKAAEKAAAKDAAKTPKNDAGAKEGASTSDASSKAASSAQGANNG
jgi:hypothetical protein